MKKVKLDKLGKIITGNTPSKKILEFYDSNDIPFIKPDDFKTIDEISSSKGNKNYISENARNNARIVPKNSVLVTCIGIIGKVMISESELSFNQQINAIVPNELILSKYLAYLLLYNKSKLDFISNAPVVPIINKTQFSEFEVTFHEDIDVQEKIIQNLENLDNQILKRRHQSKLLSNLVKSRFNEMFGDPILNDMGWEVTKLGELTNKISSGNTPKGGSQVYVDKGIMFFRSQNVWKNKILLDDIAYIDDQTNRNMKDTILEHGDLLITKTGRVNTENSSLGRTAQYLGQSGKANINGHVYLVRINSDISKRFILEILISNAYRDYIRRICVGGIDKRQLNKNHIEDFPIILPPLSLQNEFADFVAQVDKSQFACEIVIKLWRNSLKSSII